jgi:hypothetical protein
MHFLLFLDGLQSQLNSRPAIHYEIAYSQLIIFYTTGGQTCLMQEPYTINFRCLRAARHEQILHTHFYCYMHILLQKFLNIFTQHEH